MSAPYELHSSYTELPTLESPLLVVMMTGWIDAGSAAANAMAHLVEVTGATTLLTFDSDEFIDYRARRPLMELRDGVSTRLVWATPELMRGRDANGRDVLLLTGTEPDSRWNAFATCVADLAVHMGVRQMFALGAYPFALPHTRAVNISVTTPSAEWIANMPYLRSSVDVPAGVAAVLGVGYAVFAFIGMGARPFWLALALMVAGLPLYFFLRHLRKRTTRHA